MDGFAQEVRARMPLGEAVLLMWRHVADPDYLEQIFEEHRGQNYTDALSFPQMVQLTADCLLRYEGSGRRAFSAARQNGELATTVEAVYGKLERMPVEVSMTFLAGCTDRLRALYPSGAERTLPKSLRGFEVVVLDGKTIKNVQKRFKVLRRRAGGVLGGKALVVMSLNLGLVLGMHAHPDGDANEVRFVGEMLPEVDRRLGGPRLNLVDRGFCDLTQLGRFRERDHRFLVRHHPKLSFHRDPNARVAEGKDREGRTYREEWGWVGVSSDRRRGYVRRITLKRTNDEPVILLTDLLDAARYPAGDLLELYHMRWGIEQVFQQVTEVFGLEKLIGTSPRATIFQLAFCLLIYNMIQVAKGYIAVAQDRPADTISTTKFFEDVTTHLTSWPLFFSHADTIAYLVRFHTLTQVRRRLHALLDSQWTDLWIKSPARKRSRKAAGPGASRSHVSLFRLLEAEKERQRKRRRSRQSDG